jgi:hypothetical protein
VGPGIAGGLTATLSCMYFDRDYLQDEQSRSDELERHQEVEALLADGPRFDEFPLRLPSVFLPVGVSERMRLFNVDESANWRSSENDQDPRAFVVQLSGTDLEGHAAETVTAAIKWIPPLPSSWGVEALEKEFETTSRWHRPAPETESLILDAWRAWKTRTPPPGTVRTPPT